jgi:riboflavin kinase/FMN adenylyltransferase
MTQHLRSLDEVTLRKSWVTIGSFDGVHLGHQAIVRDMVLGAHSSGAVAVVVTFYPHPAKFLGRRSNAFELSTPDERARLLMDMGVDFVVTLTFNQDLANTSAKEFMVLLKYHLGLEHLWIGHDFALGRGREGTETVLRQLGDELGYQVDVVDAMQVEGVPISSTRIRSLLQSGNVRSAAQLLGRPYALSGIVVPGDQRGRMIGIPTANIEPDENKLIPQSGVYACKARILPDLAEVVFQAAVNIGIRPTFDGNSTKIHVEAHLLDFSADLYGKTLELEFIERLRGEERFSNVQALIDQIHADIQRTKGIIT